MATPPRRIEGSVGSRIRVILGATGNEWLFLTDNDDGDSEWQSHHWKNIPNKVENQLNNCSNKGRYVKNIDFGPTGSWYINGIKRDGTGGHSWWSSTTDSSILLKKKVGEPKNLKVSFGSDKHMSEARCFIQGSNGYSCSGNLNDNAKARLKRMNQMKKAVHFVRLFHKGEYFISDEEGSEWVISCDTLSEELKKPGNVEDVAKAEDGSWVVIRSNSYTFSDSVDETLKNHIIDFFNEQRNRNNLQEQKIREHHEQTEREREAAERAAREEAERTAREAAERAAQEAAERAARQEAERAAQEAAARQVAVEIDERVQSLESKLEKVAEEETKSVKELEQHLRKKQRTLRQFINELPTSKRSRFQQSIDDEGGISFCECVVCHDQKADRAVIPCGHLCLCDDCANSIMNSSRSKSCPLCRGQLQSTLKIYG